MGGGALTQGAGARRDSMDSREGPLQSAGGSVEQRLRNVKATLAAKRAATAEVIAATDRDAVALWDERMLCADAGRIAQRICDALRKESDAWDAAQAVMDAQQASQAQARPGADELLVRTQARLREAEADQAQARAGADEATAAAQRAAAKADATACVLREARAEAAAVRVALHAAQQATAAGAGGRPPMAGPQAHGVLAASRDRNDGGVAAGPRVGAARRAKARFDCSKSGCSWSRPTLSHSSLCRMARRPSSCQGCSRAARVHIRSPIACCKRLTPSPLAPRCSTLLQVRSSR